MSPNTSLFQAIALATKPATDLRTLVHSMDIDTTTDRIRITAHLYCPAKPKYKGQKNITIRHSDFEDFADASGLLDIDDTHFSVDESGEPIERGCEYQIGYAEFLTQAKPADYINYLIQTRPEIDFCPEYLRSQKVEL